MTRRLILCVAAVLCIAAGAEGRLPRYQAVDEGRASSVVVAASDSSHPYAADYVCDGDSDEVEIQAAIDSLPAHGGQVYCRAGAYSLKNKVTIGSNMALVFEPGNTIRLPADHALDEAANQYTKNTDTFSALFTNDTHTGTGNEHVIIKGANIDFEDPTGAGRFGLTQGYAAIWFDNVTYGEIADCNADQVVYDVDTGVGRSYGICVTDSMHVIVDRCSTSGNGYEGVGIRGDCSYIIVRNCIAANNKVHAGQVAAWYPTQTGGSEHVVFDGFSCVTDDLIFHGTVDGGLSDVRLINCNALQYYIMGAVQQVGIVNCTGERLTIKGATSGAYELKNVAVTGNIFTRDTVAPLGNAVLDIWTNDNSDTVMSSITVSGNAFIDGQLIIRGDAGNSSAPSNVTVSGNAFDCSALTGQSALLISNPGTGDMNDIRIIGNMFRHVKGTSTARGISLNASSTGEIQRLCISNNHFECYAGIYCFNDGSTVGNVNQVLINGNTFRCNIAGNAIHTGDPMKYVRVTNNIFNACAYAIGVRGDTDAGDFVLAMYNTDWATTGFADTDHLTNEDVATGNVSY